MKEEDWGREGGREGRREGGKEGEREGRRERGREGGYSSKSRNLPGYIRCLVAHLLQLPAVQVVVSKSVKPPSEDENNSLTGAGYDRTTCYWCT